MLEAEEYEAFAELVRRLDAHGTLARTWQLTGGVSAQVTGLEMVRADGSIQKMVARRHGAVARQRNPQIAADEFRLLQILRAEGVAAPTPYLLEDSGTVFDTPCIVMEYIEGVAVFSPPDRTGFLRQFAEQLARIHGVRGADLSFLPQCTRGFGEHSAILDDSLQEGEIRDALESLWPLPQQNESVLLHGDYWPGNVLWRDGQLVAVIDWEDAAWGDPLADIGNSRMEILWTFGREAMDLFTNEYASWTTIDFANLAYWDLCAALRPASKIGGWGLDADTERDMREKHHWFVAQAIERVGPSPG